MTDFLKMIKLDFRWYKFYEYFLFCCAEQKERKKERKKERRVVENKIRKKVIEK